MPVYFIRAVSTPYVKIGWTGGHIPSRIKSLQVGCPYTLELEGSLPGCLDDETKTHQKYAKHKVRGEWFELSTEKVVEICSGNPKPQEPGVLPTPPPDIRDYKITLVQHDIRTFFKKLLGNEIPRPFQIEMLAKAICRTMECVPYMHDAANNKYEEDLEKWEHQKHTFEKWLAGNTEELEE